MKKYNWTVIALFVLLALGLSACERSASAPVVATEEGNFPVPEGTRAPMDVLEDFSTQTAIAESGGAVPAETSESAVMAAEEAAATEAPKPTETPQPQAAPAAEEEDTDTGAGTNAETVKTYDVPSTYTLQPGEFPYCIARRFDIAPASLLTANGLSSSSMTYPGTKLAIPQDAPHFNQGARALRQHPTTYTVQGGDTVNSIACLFGDVDPRAIVDKNGLTGSYTLNVGQTLQIP